MRHIRSMIFAMGLCSACASKPQPSAAPPPAATCLAAVSGEGAAEQQLRRSQKRAAASADEAGAWVEVGQAWMRVARVHSQPELFRAAEDCTTQALALAPKIKQRTRKKVI